MPRCIYCNTKKPSSEFNREHVLPELLGTFEQNLTLREHVCKECNRYFGDHVEPTLAEGAYESVIRLHRGIKGASAARFLRRSRIQIQWDGPLQWNGLFLGLVESDGKLGYEPRPQIGFKRIDGMGFVYVEEAELAAKRCPPDGTDPRLGTAIVWNNAESRDRLLRLVRELDLPTGSPAQERNSIV